MGIDGSWKQPNQVYKSYTGGKLSYYSNQIFFHEFVFVFLISAQYSSFIVLFFWRQLMCNIPLSSQKTDAMETDSAFFICAELCHRVSIISIINGYWFQGLNGIYPGMATAIPFASTNFSKKSLLDKRQAEYKCASSLIVYFFFCLPVVDVTWVKYIVKQSFISCSISINEVRALKQPRLCPASHNIYNHLINWRLKLQNYLNCHTHIRIRVICQVISW